MCKAKTFYAVLNYFIIVSAHSTDYWNERDKLIKLEESRMVGGSIVLNEKERIVNKVLMGYKISEYDQGFKTPGIFAPGRHFFDARKDIEQSKVFDFIKKVPKGASLHGHDSGLVSEDFIYKLTFKDDLYGCVVDNKLKMRFLLRPDQDTTCDWTLLSILRKRDPNFDKWLRSHLTLYCENPRETYKDINEVWNVFRGLFTTVESFMMYRPVFEEYFYEYLDELYNDNVMYAEIRGTLPLVYELDGTTYSSVETVGFFKKVFQKFKEDHPDFWGARFIYAPFRGVNNTTITTYVKILRDISEKYPNVIAGFDLVGQEDLGNPLSEFVKELLPLSGSYNFFFHAGETNWYGSTTDFNLIDAVLLGTKRIGHGFALAKHPQLLKLIKERNIAIEVCPISNQVLKLVDDMRNHPAAFLLADGYPVVIGADDPSFWSTKGLSYDFYMAFMGIASRNADLRLLKQLAINSLQYSAIPETEKIAALEAWRKKWDAFLDEIIDESFNSIKANQV